MEDQYIPHPAKNFTPRRNPPQTPLGGQGRALDPVDITDKDALRALGLKTLVSVIQANPNALAVVPALKELFDRVDGKAMQSQQTLLAVAQTSHSGSETLSQDQIENLLITAQIKGVLLA